MVPTQRRRVVPGVAIGMMIVGIAALAFSVGRMARTTSEATAPTVEVGAFEQPVAEATELEDTAGEAQTEPQAAIQQPTPSEPEFVIVYISGAVIHPDTYRLPAEARVKDVVVAAGGLAPDANSDNINLSEHISDAQHIYVPHLGEQAVPNATSTTVSKAAGGAATGLININTANPAELEPLPGIGTALAQRIVDWRTANGPFKAIADIQKVKGITSSVYNEIKEKITVD